MTRNKPEQDEYELDLNRYGLDFWETVCLKHFEHRFSFDDTLPFLHQMSGYCMPWPDLCRRFPAMLRKDRRLFSRLNVQIQTKPRRTLGDFEWCSKENVEAVFEKIHEGRIENTTDTMICYYMMDPQHWSLLTDHVETRWEMAKWLDRLLVEDQMEALEQKIGPHIEAFVRLIGAAPPHAP